MDAERLAEIADAIRLAQATEHPDQPTEAKVSLAVSDADALVAEVRRLREAETLRLVAAAMPEATVTVGAKLWEQTKRVAGERAERIAELEADNERHSRRLDKALDQRDTAERKLDEAETRIAELEKLLGERAELPGENQALRKRVAELEATIRVLREQVHGEELYNE